MRQVLLVLGAWGFIAATAGVLAARAFRDCERLDAATRAWLDEQFAAQRVARGTAQRREEVAHLERLFAASPSLSDEQSDQH